MGAAARERAWPSTHRPCSLVPWLRRTRAILPSSTAKSQAADDLVISLPTDNRSPHLEPYFAGSRAGFAHCTAVRFIDPQHLVVASLLGRDLFLMRLDLERGTSEVVSTLRSTDGQQDVSVDLLDFDGRERLVTSNCEFSSVSTYLVGPNRLQFERSQAVVAGAVPYCHGVAFMPERPGVLCASLTTGFARVEFLTADGPPIEPFIDVGWIPKSVSFVGSLMVVASVMDNNAMHPSLNTAAEVALVALGTAGAPHIVLDSHRFDGSSFDGCHARGNVVYIADQECDVVRVFEVHNERLTPLPNLEGLSFPHDVGVSLDGTLIAVATYGRNELRIRRTGRGSVRRTLHQGRSHGHQLAVAADVDGYLLAWVATRISATKPARPVTSSLSIATTASPTLRPASSAGEPAWTSVMSAPLPPSSRLSRLTPR